MASERATALVTKIQTMDRKLRDLRVEIYGLTEEVTREGGTDLTDLHFLDENGDPRTDLYLTKPMLASGLYGITDLLTTLNAHATHYINAAN